MKVGRAKGERERGRMAGVCWPVMIVKRLNWGCGDWIVPGWVNSDLKGGDGVVACDIREGLPFEDASFDYVVSIHALPELAYPELVPALRELLRVLKPGGVLRLGLPDLTRSYEAYRRGERDFFLIPDDERTSVGGKFVTQVLWYGYSRTFFVPEFIEELLVDAGFSSVQHVAFRDTRGPYPEIVELDNRELESLFIEGTK
jgi:SAM-dependent methyltransferase